MMDKIDKRRCWSGFGAAQLVFSLLLYSLPVNSATIPNIPLQTSTSSAPNVMMILDDSGSMHWEIMPDAYIDAYYVFPRASGIYGGSDYGNYVPTPGNIYEMVVRSSANNSVYYNPAVTYKPWSKADGTGYPNAVPTAAYHNPENTGKGSRLLTSNSTESANWVSCTSASNCSSSSSSKTYYPATYYTFSGDPAASSDVWDSASYTKVEIRSSTSSYSGEGRADRSDCAAAGSATCTYSEEIQNFANWYTYYRSRILTARAGIGRAFGEQGTNFRVGFAAINSGTKTIDGVSTATLISGVRPFLGEDRNNFFGNLYQHVVPAANTPLRQALDNVGKYYSRTDNQSPINIFDSNCTGGGNFCEKFSTNYAESTAVETLSTSVAQAEGSCSDSNSSATNAGTGITTNVVYQNITAGSYCRKTESTYSRFGKGNCKNGVGSYISSGKYCTKKNNSNFVGSVCPDSTWKLKSDGYCKVDVSSLTSTCDGFCTPSASTTCATVSGNKTFCQATTTQSRTSVSVTTTTDSDLNTSASCAGFCTASDTCSGTYPCVKTVCRQASRPQSCTTGGPSAASCRQNYAILMTDGYWNGSAASTSGAAGNSDGTAGTTILGAKGESFQYSPVSPYSDSASGTLADVASYYWKRDLRTDLINNVPPNSRDPAYWQHMVTFGIGLGVTGSVEPDRAFAAMTNSDTVTWPDPTRNNSANSSKIDDLLHASVNGHGGFFNAASPEAFSEALSSVLNDIVNRSGSASSIAANSTQLTADTRIYNAKFNTANWTGELEALPLSSTGVSATPSWKASEQIPAPGSRKIFTRSGGSNVEFIWSSLSQDDQTLLVSEDNVNFIRGVRTKELKNGGILRNRASILGDIVHSSPAYSSDTNTVFVGANDGMLHAFNAADGNELFAYIPSSAIPNLIELTKTNYDHLFYVDGDVAVSNGTLTPSKTYVVAALGRGGKGLFALDATTPSSFGASNIKWEKLDTTDVDLGYMLGTPILAKMNGDKKAVIVSNGYNSTNGKAVLYIIDIETGATIRKLDTLVGGDNGLATPAVVDSDNDGDVDFIYAGDLKGNVWKFDVSSADSALWGMSFQSGTGPSPIFVAQDAQQVRQPITAPMSVAVNTIDGDTHYGKRYIIFGTGAFFRSADPEDTASQSWYGLIDEGQVISRAQLKARTITEVGTVGGVAARSFSLAVADDMVGKSGWLIDFSQLNAAGNAQGERIVTASKVYSIARKPVLLASSIIPMVDPCSPGGMGYINAISPFSGAGFSEGFFDMNGDGNFNNDTLPNGGVVGSINPGVGMPTAPLNIGRRVVVGGSSGGVGSVAVPGAGSGGTTDPGFMRKSGRISWREITRD